MFLHNITGITLVTGNNATLYDKTGKDYIDFTSGIFVANIGHGNEYVREALANNDLIHCYTYNHPLREEYIERLCAFTGFTGAALFSSGTEATEAAWRVAYRKKGMKGVYGLHDAFHGRTMGARIMASDEPSPHYAQPGENTCMIIWEPYTAHLARLQSKKTCDRIRGLTNSYKLVSCADEIQAGFGRTGKMFGYQHLEMMEPEFVCIGKGMGNGFPISGLLGPKELLSDPIMPLSSTHGGNPLACAVGLAVLDYFTEFEVIQKAADKGAILQLELDNMEMHSEGVGMIAAIHCGTSDWANDLVLVCAQKGLLVVHTGRETVKIGPPLTIPKPQLADGCAILREAIDEVAARRG